MATQYITRHGLKSKWSVAADLSRRDTPLRFEGEVGDLVVYGKIPPKIDGTFYRISPDRFIAKENSVPVNGHNLISAFHIQGGHVDFKAEYVEIERYKLECRAKKTLFSLYKNHEPIILVSA